MVGGNLHLARHNLQHDHLHPVLVTSAQHPAPSQGNMTEVHQNLNPSTREVIEDCNNTNRFDEAQDIFSSLLISVHGEVTCVNLKSEIKIKF